MCSVKRCTEFPHLEGLVSLLLFCLTLSVTPASAFALPYAVDVDTSLISGTSAQLVVDVISGGGPLSNTVTISDFSTTGTLGISGPKSGIVNGDCQEPA
jgi:hypothetical protein